jgi:hypothetical protein
VKKKGLLSVKIPGLSRTVEEKPAGSPKISIDSPQEGERVRRGHYAIRISAGAGQCQAAIDEGGWQDCRSDAGYAWLDWFPEKAGAHRIMVRTRVSGKWIKAERVCDVE